MSYHDYPGDHWMDEDLPESEIPVYEYPIEHKREPFIPALFGCIGGLIRFAIVVAVVSGAFALHPVAGVIVVIWLLSL